MNVTPQQPRFQLTAATRDGLLAFGVLAALSLILYSPALLGGKTLLLRDIQAQFYGLRWWYRESLASGQLPQWTSQILGGTPFLANPQTSVFYPLSVIFLVFPLAYAFAVHIALHCALLGFFVYCLGRSMRLTFGAALLAGMAAGFAGIPMKHIEFPEELAGLAWTPLVLLGARGCLVTAAGRGPAVLGFALGMQLLAGSPYPPFYAAVGILCAVGVFGPAITARWQAARRLGLGILLGGLIGCAQYIPTLCLIRGTPQHALTGVLPALYSMRLRDLLHLASPWLAGYPNWQKCFYLGLLPLVCAAVALRFALRPGPAAETAGQRPSFAARDFWFCAALIFTGAVLAQSGYLGLDRLLAQVPLVTRATKWPTLAMCLAVLGLAVLAGAGLDQWVEAGRTFRRKCSVTLGAAAGLGAVLLLGEALRGAPWTGALRSYLRETMVGFSSAALDPQLYPLPGELLRLAAILAALACILLLVKSERWMRPALGLVAAVDLVSAWNGLNYYAPKELYQEQPQILRQARSDGEAAGLERVITPLPSDSLNDLTYGSHSLEEFRSLREMLAGNIGMNLHLFTVDGAASVGLGDYQLKLLPVLNELALGGNEKADEVLGRWNVGLMVGGRFDAQGRFHLQRRVNPRVRPRARLVERVEIFPEQDRILRALARAEWTTDSVLLTPRERRLADAVPAPGGADGEPGRVTRIEYRPNGVEVDAEAARPCILVLAENWADGWSAQVDGARAELYRVNFLQQAVALPPGPHQVRFHYAAPGLSLGLAVGALGWLGLGLAVFAGVRAKGRRPASGQ